MRDKLRAVKMFNEFTPKEAVDYLGWYLTTNEIDDERCSDAIKRLDMLLHEMEFSNGSEYPYLFVKKDCLDRLKDYGFVYNADNIEWRKNAPRYEYWDGGVKKTNTKPILAVYDDGEYDVKMMFKSTYYAYSIPSVVFRMIKDGIVVAEDDTDTEVDE